MRTKQLFHFILLAYLLVGLLSGCIKDEPLNPEADIISFNLPEGVAKEEITIDGVNIHFTAKNGANLKQIVPQIEISKGATIEPSALTPQDFSQPVTYTVTSQNQENKKVYTVSAHIFSPLVFNFEHWKQTTSFGKTYELPYELKEDNQENLIWSGSNVGVVVYLSKKNPEDFPVHKTTDSRSGKYAAEIVSRTGPGNIGGVLNIPITAGSLFAGSMDLNMTFINPLASTRFGIPIHEEPIRFKGFYKYKAGQGKYILPSGEETSLQADSCAIYAVFYETDDQLKTLDGSNILSHKNIISVAKLKDGSSTPGDEYVPFDLPFIKRRQVKPNWKQKNYKIAIIFSSSYDGNNFAGIPGSTLIIDDVEIITQ